LFRRPKLTLSCSAEGKEHFCKMQNSRATAERKFTLALGLLAISIESLELWIGELGTVKKKGKISL
jgi:hypothetical protein